jgi:hypothetical protein
MFFLPARSPAPVQNRASSSLSLLVLLGMFAVVCPEIRGYDISFTARPKHETEDMDKPTKPTPAPTIYTFSGTPEDHWEFNGDQLCPIGFSAVTVKAVTKQSFTGSFTVAAGVTEIFEAKFHGNLSPTGTAAGNVVLEKWAQYAWDHTIKITTNPVYVRISDSANNSELTREGPTSATLTALGPDTRAKEPFWSANPAYGISFSSSQAWTTTITNTLASSGREIQVTARAEKAAPFEGSYLPSATATCMVVDVNIASSTVAEKDENGTAVFVPVVSLTATGGGVPVNLVVNPNTSLTGAVKLEASSNNFAVYRDATFSTALISGTQTTATFASASAVPSSVYLRGVTASASAAGSDTLTLSFTPSAQTGGSAPSVFKDKIKVLVVKVDISPATMDAIESLDSDEFICTVTPSDLAPTYRWLTGSANGAWPATAGNEPNLNYSAPTANKTIVKETRWFAKTPSRRLKVDGEICNYWINCEVTIGSSTYRYATPRSLFVQVSYGGTTYPPEFSDWQDIPLEQINGEWKTESIGPFSRSAPRPVVYVPVSSQFYSKLMVHENKHVKQWTEESPLKDLFNATTLYNSTLSKLRSTENAQDLRGKINAAVVYQQTIDTAIFNNNRCAKEAEAYDAMNATEVTPHFLELDDGDWESIYNCQ